MCNKTYVFGCGHSAEVYLSAKDTTGNNGRYCPICFDVDKPVSGAHNRCRRLACIKTTCEICGEPLTKTGHSMNMTKHFICSQCRKRKEQEQQRRSREKLRILKAAGQLDNEVQSKSKLKVLVTCPKCRRQRYLRTSQQFSTQAVLWKYCESCNDYVRKYTDCDPAIYAGRSNDVVVAGKRVE